jgi:hypothetical protein
MPAFSLPGTSIGSEEAESYLNDREAGVGRGTASQGFRHLRLSPGYGKHLERMFSTAISQAKALFPEVAGALVSGLQWVHAAVGTTDRPLWLLNRFSLAHGYNCLCFCRASILSFSSRSARSRVSHNRGSPEG